MTDLEKKKKEQEAARDAYQNRGAFNYDVTGDALYDQYKNQYKQRAEAASSDAIGKASAMTGGYGNSYAQMLGQQAYANEMAQFGQMENQLYQAAMDRYDRETNQLLNKYNMLSSEVDKEMAHEQAIADANARAEEAKFDGIYGLGEGMVELGLAKDATEAAKILAKLTGLNVDENGNLIPDTGDAGGGNGGGETKKTAFTLKEYNNDGANNYTDVLKSLDDAIKEAERTGKPLDLENSGLAVTDYGGKNRGGGIDRDAKIKFNNGTINLDEISLADLRKQLIREEGMSRSDANYYIKTLSELFDI